MVAFKCVDPTNSGEKKQFYQPYERLTKINEEKIWRTYSVGPKQWNTGSSEIWDGDEIRIQERGVRRER
jgi:hypothetical protein